METRAANHVAAEEHRGDLAKSSRMKKARSVDFGRFLRSSLRNPADSSTVVASAFSQRAARDSFSNCTSVFAPSLSEKCSATATTDNLLLQKGWPNGTAISAASSFPPSASSFPIGTWTLGKLSVLVLALASLTDLALSHIYRLESPADFYDALSADVIRPPFRYKSSTSIARTRSSLGSAAISSVTEFLSPILPFTGGLDLRREDYWTTSGSWLETLESLTRQIQEALFSSDDDRTSLLSSISLIRSGSLSNKMSPRVHTKGRNTGTVTKHVSSISAQKPFFSEDEIAELSLVEVAQAFRYASESSSTDFNEDKFLNSLTTRVRRMILSIREAVSESRGIDVEDACVLTKNHRVNGSVDALKFSAAMRIFAEWRILRQVPEGYKGYAVGMNLGHKDVVQNVAKIEQAVHSWLDNQRDLRSLSEIESQTGCPIIELRSSNLCSPTIRELMQDEVDMDIHPTNRLPRLKEKTAAMGILWVRRQLHYQTGVFGNLLVVPESFPTTERAVASAYKEVYDKYHGWAVQKIFSYSFQSAPKAEEIYQHMNPERLKEVKAAADELVLHFDSESRCSAKGMNISPKGNLIDVILQNASREFENLVEAFLQLVNSGMASPGSDVRGGGCNIHSSDENDRESFIAKEMIKDAHKHIEFYLEVVRPLLDDLALVFDELNMDDPTKV